VQGLAAFVASAMIKTFQPWPGSTGTIIEPAVTLAVLTGTIAWVLFASRTGFPVSTTHALTGAIVGAGFGRFRRRRIDLVRDREEDCPSFVVSPFLALTVSLLIHPAVVRSRGSGMGLLVRDAASRGVGGDRSSRRNKDLVCETHTSASR